MPPIPCSQPLGHDPAIWMSKSGWLSFGNQTPGCPAGIVHSMSSSLACRTQRDLENVASELEVERTTLVTQLRHVDVALSVLGKPDSGRTAAKPRITRTYHVLALAALLRPRVSRMRWPRIVSRKGFCRRTCFGSRTCSFESRLSEYPEMNTTLVSG